MSIQKFADTNPARHLQDDRLYWGRVGIDGAPIKGNTGTLYKNEEFEQLSRREYDTRVAVFKLWEPEALAKYTEVLDRTANGWYKVLFVDRQFDQTHGNMLVYIEWVEPYIAIDAPQGQL